MISDEQILEFHRRSRDAVRAVLQDLPEVAIREKDPERGFSIAEEIGHLIAAEYFFLSESDVEPGFAPMDSATGQLASIQELQDRLHQVEQRWALLLRDNPDRRGLRVIIARMALHTLYHLARMADRRARVDPGFQLPHWSKCGSWEFAIEPLLQALCGNEAKPSHGTD